ncbi:MAG: hypothetical protein HFH08_01015 [Bacilli bacterium]|nr:hypothetical protein [Bacilli bacterium]
MASKSWKKNVYKNIFLNLERVIFLMKKTIEEKLQMCKEHVIEGKSLSLVCELYNTKNIDDLKYLVNLYKWRRTIFK